MLSLLVAAALAAGAPAHAAEITSRGSLKVTPGTRMLAVSTDPVMQTVLNQDLSVAQRRLSRAAPVATITVSVSQAVLAPGVSLNQLAPGDPGVASLLRAAGAEPPPLGDAAGRGENPYAILARRQALMPGGLAAAQMHDDLARRRQMFNRRYQTPHGPLRNNQVYDTAIIARATLSGGPGEVTVVAVVHPGGDLRAARELVAEAIANAVLH